MAAWGTRRSRDEITVALLTRDGWRSPRDVLAECVWCGLPYWASGDNANAGKREYCSEACRYRKKYWLARAKMKKEMAA